MATREPYAEVVIAAADKDQAKDRVLRSIKFAVQNGPLDNHTKVFRDIIEFDNHSIIQALPADWKGSAGGNYSCVIFDELHTYTLESQRRLYDELIIPPTVRSGVRWIASYAGFLGESDLLEEIWSRALAGEKESGELPLYYVPEASLLALIHQGKASWRMPWTTPQYISEVQANERPNTFRHLWLNEWVTSESAFILPEQWKACYSADVELLCPHDKRNAVLGADASTSRDLTALVGCCKNPEDKSVHAVYCRAWKPKRGKLRGGKTTIYLDTTIKAEILRLHKVGQVAAVVYDPFQLHSIALDLEKAGVKMIEMPQTASRVESDQSLYDAVIGRTLKHPSHPTLNEHMRNAVANETPRGFRLAKEKTTMKIDAAVALSMAHHGALETRTLAPAGELINDIPMSVYKTNRDEWRRRKRLAQIARSY